MIKNKILSSILFFLWVFSGSAQNGFRFDGTKAIPGISIVIGRNPTTAVNLAAKEFRYHIEKSTGFVLPIVFDKPVQGTRPICIGKSDYTRKLKLNVLHLHDQEYLIDVTKERIVLLGKDDNSQNEDGIDNNRISIDKDRPFVHYGDIVGDKKDTSLIQLPSIYDAQGSCYAVYDFLERFLGIRWFGPDPDNVVIPKHSSLEIPATKIRRSPVIKYRVGTYTMSWPIMKDQYFTSTKEMNQLYLRRMRSGGEKWVGSHSFESFQDRFLKKNPDHPKLFESYHPEYFAKDQNNKVNAKQFDYNNPGLIKQVEQDAADYFSGKGLKGGQMALGDFFAIVPPDNAHWCMCDECTRQLALDSNNIIGEHFNNGLASYYIWNFINKIAKNVKRQFPGKKISALAYWNYAFLPHKIKLEDNISVGICLQNRNYWVPKIMENEMKFYREWIDESKKSHRLIYLWNYYTFPTERGIYTHFNVFPGFGIHSLAEQIKMYARDGVRGVFLCGIGEQVDYYITMKLYDNPNQDVDKLLAEFFNIYFGNASKPMEEFYSLIESVYNNPDSYPKEVRTSEKQYHQTEEIAWKYLGTDKIMAKLEHYILEAQKMAVTEMEKKRVNSWKVGVFDYMKAGKENYERGKGQLVNETF